MNPQQEPSLQPQNQDPANPQNIYNPLSSMQPGEQVLCEIKRHPIGIFGLYIMTGIMLIVLAIVVFGVLPSIVSDTSRSSALGIGAVVFLVLTVLTVIFLFVSNIVYWGNRWIVTSDSITQISQRSLFDKQSSQLSLGNLEDVTTEQNGILAHIFNYGLIKAETAGERSKFTLLYCPTPDKYAQQILQAREVFEQGYRGGKIASDNSEHPADANVNTNS